VKQQRAAARAISNSTSMSTAAAAAAAALPSPSPPPSWSSSWPDWRPDSSQRPTVALLDCRDLGPVPYETAWELQKRLVDALLAQRRGQGGENSSSSPSPSSSSSSSPSSSPRRRPVGALILLQHEPVYTLGAGATTENLRFDPGRAFLEGEGEGGAAAEEEEEQSGTSKSNSSSSNPRLPPPPAPLHRVERGGEVTWHGPGQLVLYPILDLRAGEGEDEGQDDDGEGEGEGEGEGGGGGGGEERAKRPFFLTDLHWYLRALEEVVVSALARLPSHPLLSREPKVSQSSDRRPPLLLGEREPGLTGVWVGGAKAAALGVRAARWATYHGLALNVNPDLSYFDHIVPCGIVGREVASVATAWEKEETRLKNSENESDENENDNENENDKKFSLPSSWKDSPGEGPLVTAAGDALLAAFCEVLGVRLESVEGGIPRELLLLLPGSKGRGDEGKKEQEMVLFAERVVRGR